VLGIERVLLVDKENDTLLDVIEKIVIVPENKLVYVEPIVFKTGRRTNSNGEADQSWYSGGQEEGHST